MKLALLTVLLSTFFITENCLANCDPPQITYSHFIEGNLILQFEAAPLSAPNGFNIYRNDEFLDFVPFTGDTIYSYYFTEEPPGTNIYCVTSVCSANRNGTEINEESEPACVTIDCYYGFPLPFEETWDFGSFEADDWTVSSDAWMVAQDIGNDAPAAVFQPETTVIDYTEYLESYYINAFEITEGNIFLEFDLKLSSTDNTGTEHLQVQVWDNVSGTYTVVADYSSQNGSFGWMKDTINIRAYSMDKVFKVRFAAYGENSSHISYWGIDNIHIFRSCKGPTNLTATAVNDGTLCGIYLSWIGPDAGLIDQWIHWDDGMNSGNSFGNGSAMTFDVAARWDTDQLTEYDGATVTEVAFFPMEAQCSYNVRVWIGAGAANLLVDQNVPAPMIGQWNYITLDTPLQIDITQELWVGYHVDTQTGYPAGVDIGPAIDGYGNMINLNGWQSLLEIDPDMNYNWNIAVHVVKANRTFNPGTGSRELVGYNIYRSINNEEYVLIEFTTNGYFESCDDLSSGLYCYKVTAVWSSETDLCESPFSNEACVVWTGIGENAGAATSSISLYPNPAGDHALITTPGRLQRVTVFNALGRLAIDEPATGKEYELNTAGYPVGAYMVKVQTETGVTTRILTIRR